MINNRIVSQLSAIATVLSQPTRTNVPNLMHGTLGHVLFLAYYYQLTREEQYLEIATELLESSIGTAESTDQVSAFGTGFTGLCWLVDHLVNQELLDPEALELTAALHAQIVQSLQADLERGDFDLIYGFIGKAIYFTEAQPGRFTTQLQQVADYYRLTAQVTPIGTYWVAAGSNRVNLGLAHGMPSIILSLLHLHQLSILTAADEMLIHDGLAYLLAQRRATADPAESLYPAFSDPEPKPSSRLAWCYGDLGVALVLLYAAKTFPAYPAYQVAGRAVAVHSAFRVLEHAGLAVEDAAGYYDVGWCHGAAGITYLFRRLSDLVPDEPALKQAYHRWLEATVMNLEVHLEQFDTVDRRHKTAHDGLSWELATSLLDGLAGAGLVLIAALRPELHAWDRVFLVGPPPISALGVNAARH